MEQDTPEPIEAAIVTPQPIDAELKDPSPAIIDAHIQSPTGGNPVPSNVVASANPKGQGIVAYLDALQAVQTPGARWIVFGGCFLLCLLGNLLLPTLWWETGSPGDELYFATLMCALGALSSEFGALAVWFGLGNQRVWGRMLICFTASMILTCVYVVGLVIHDPIPAWATAIILGIGMGATLLLGAALMGLSAITKLRMVHRDNMSGLRASSGIRSSDIRFLAIVTAVVALGIALIKTLVDVSSLSQGGPSAGEFTDFILVVLQGSIICLTIMVGLLLLIMGSRWSIGIGFGILVAVAFFLIPLNFVVINLGYRTMRMNVEFVVYYYSFMLGFTVLTAIYCVLGRLVGYQVGRLE